MRLRDRPLKLACTIAFGTIACALGGFDLLDGAISLRRLGDLNAATTPLRFWTFVGAYALGCCFVVFGWFVLRDEWRVDHKLPPKPHFDDPTRRG